MAQDPYSALGEGFKSGLSMVSSITQMAQQRRQQAWENDYKQFTTGMELLNSKALTDKMRAKIYNDTVKSKWNQWNPQTPLPDWDGSTDSPMAGYMTNMRAAATEAQKEAAKTGKFDFKKTHGLISSIAAEAYQAAQGNKEAEGTITNVRDSLLNSLKYQSDIDKDARESGRKSGESAQDAQQKALKRQTEIVTAYTNLKSKGIVTPEMAAQFPSLQQFVGMKLQEQDLQPVLNTMVQESEGLRSAAPGMKRLVPADKLPALRQSILQRQPNLAPNQVEALIQQRAIVIP